MARGYVILHRGAAGIQGMPRLFEEGLQHIAILLCSKHKIHAIENGIGIGLEKGEAEGEGERERGIHIYIYICRWGSGFEVCWERSHVVA